MAGLLDLLQAQWLLVWAQFLIWVLPRGRLLRGAASVATGTEQAGVDTVLARRLALAIARAAEHGVSRPACLVRAVALNRMLCKRGIEGGQVRIGVRMRGGTFAAHAWVELGDLILGDEEWHVSTFTTVEDLSPAGL
jgi:hypothetical protein